MMANISLIIPNVYTYIQAHLYFQDRTHYIQELTTSWHIHIAKHTCTFLGTTTHIDKHVYNGGIFTRISRNINLYIIQAYIHTVGHACTYPHIQAHICYIQAHMHPSRHLEPVHTNAITRNWSTWSSL